MFPSMISDFFLAAMPMVAMAAPSLIQSRSTSQLFTIEFTSPNPANSSEPFHHPAVFTRNATNNIIVLAAADVSTCHGTPAFYNTGGQTTDSNGFLYGGLNFDIPDCGNYSASGVYGAFGADVGEVYGLGVAIQLQKSTQDFSWLHNGDGLGYRMAAASNGFFACNSTINGNTRLVLSWGVCQTRPFVAPPEGCYWTSVSTSDVTGEPCSKCPV